MSRLVFPTFLHNISSTFGETVKLLLVRSSLIDFNGHKLVGVQEKRLPQQDEASKTYIVDLLWSPSNNHDLPKSIFVKKIGSDAENGFFDASTQNADIMDKLDHQSRLMHDSECTVYSIAKLRDVIPLPRCYAFSKIEEDNGDLLVLEDLSDRGTLLKKQVVFGSCATPGQIKIC